MILALDACACSRNEEKSEEFSGCLTLPMHLAARLHDDRRGVALERMAEGVVRGQEVPGVAAGLHQRLSGRVGQHVGVVDPVNRVRRALGVGEVRRRRAGIDHDGVLFLHDVVDRQPDAGVQHVHEDVDLLDVDPLPRDGGADVGLVLVIGRDQVDLPALGRHPGILDSHLGGNRRAGAAKVGVKSGLIGQHADLDVLVLRAGGAAAASASAVPSSKAEMRCFMISPSIQSAAVITDQTPR